LKKKLRVLTNRAHCGHQYELWKLPIEVSIVSEVGDLIEGWAYEMRPFPDNAKYIKGSDVKTEDFDLIICHFDENALSPKHQVLSDTWGKAFRWLIDNFSRKIPTVAICHGVPQFEEQGKIEIETLEVTPYEDRRQNLVDYLSHIKVICNSNVARENWKFKNTKTIWHGFDPNEFSLGSRDKGILAINAYALSQRPHYRGYYTHRDILKNLDSCVTLHHTSVACPEELRGDTQAYAAEKFKRYRSVLGSYKVFLNTTIISPMPRARGEAMMCGLVSVNYDSHDISDIIENEVDGYVSKDPKEIADILNFLNKNQEIALKMGLKSREKAIKLLHLDRYHKDWKETINEVMGTYSL